MSLYCELSCVSSDKHKIPGTWGCSFIWKETLAGCGAKVEIFGLEMLLYGERYFEAHRRRTGRHQSSPDCGKMIASRLFT